jgi:RimJ/RimL family protein N-acetyltransferase
MILTERLELRPMTVPFMQALYEGRLADAARLERVRLPDRWDLARPHWWLKARITRVEAVPGLAAWALRAIVRRTDTQVVGNIGFHEPPGMHPFEQEVPGIVEFGYGVAPEFRRQGYALEAAQGLIGWAHEEHRVRDFQLSIALDNVPSQQLAFKLGFTRHGEYVHPQRGTEYLYRLKVELPS